MNKFLLTETKNSPRINFDPDQNVFEVAGRSFPENAETFYKGPLNWVENFTPEEGSTINVDIKLQYVSSSSLICVLQLIKLFGTFRDKGINICINWLYQEDDEDIRYTGEDLANLSEMKFNYQLY